MASAGTGPDMSPAWGDNFLTLQTRQDLCTICSWLGQEAGVEPSGKRGNPFGEMPVLRPATSGFVAFNL